MRGRLHIGVFAATPPPFHGSSYAVELLLQSRLGEVHRLTHINTQYAASVADTGRPSIAKVGRFIQHLRQLVKVHRREPFDYVLVAPAFTLWPCVRDMLALLVIDRAAHARIVAWSHSNDARAFYDRAAAPVRWLMRAGLRGLTHIVTTSDRLRYNFDGLLAADRISAIPNGLPPRRRAARHRQDGPTRVVYLSNMMRAKGWPELLAAAAIACQDRADLLVRFYGAPSADSPRGAIERAFAECPFPDRIQYGGTIAGEEKEAMLDEADVLCLPSYYGPEALPMSILEAMRAGMAVIASPVGAIADLVVDAEGGILVPPRDVAALAGALGRLADSVEERARMGVFNQRRFAERFAMDRVAGLWIDLFRTLEERTT